MVINEELVRGWASEAAFALPEPDSLISSEEKSKILYFIAIDEQED